MWSPIEFGRKQLSLGSLLIRFLLLLGAAQTIGCHLKYRRSPEIYRHATHNSHEPASSAGANQAPAEGIYLESLDDLEHVAYLAMRNFNITDQSLIQSGWNLLSKSNNNNKQYQKVVASSTTSVGADNAKEGLALMLESFILHLRNGHLRQLKLEELKEIVSVANLRHHNATQDGIVPSGPENSNTTANGSSFVGLNIQTGLYDTDSSGDLDESRERCIHLVGLYAHEIKERQKLSLASSKQQTLDATANGQQQAGNVSAPVAGGHERSFDQLRLVKLCQLVVRCHSAEDLVGLLRGPWHDDLGELTADPLTKINESSTRSDDSATEAAEPTYENYPNPADGFLGHKRPSARPRSLRDSLSQSLAKLCPLMLFQLHDEDGLCSFRRDDRPSMVTVWGFATLFVTIVSFVSLIGLSITPLLGPSANRADQASSSSSSSELSTVGRMQVRPTQQAGGSQRNRQSSFGYHPRQHQHQHRACLTLFEGLAVGSLVGSALFSLIPQAFELQERESNQGFLLKALIIFFGIYLFFCSERIMRIILDTRQYRKRKRRSSNSHTMPSTTVDNLAGFATPTTGSSAIQHQSKQHHYQPPKQRPGSSRDCQQYAATLQDPATGPICGDPMGGSIRLRGQQHNQPASVEHLTSNRCVNFPAAKPEAANQSEGATRRGAGSRRRGRIDLDVATGAASRAASSRGERRQATKRHQTRTRRSTTAAGRRQKRKTRYQLLVQSKRLHSDSLTLPREPDIGRQHLDDIAGGHRDRLALRKRGSLSSTDDAASYNLDSSVHDSGSLAEESYDSTTSLDSSSSDSDTDLTDHKLLPKRSHHLQTHNLIGAGQPRSPMMAGLARRQSGPHLQAGITPDSSPWSGQSQIHSRVVMPTNKQRPSSVSANQNNQLNGEQEISTVAWMIVLGDGLHNFIDGISIGAAFSESILSGVSISVAVICEEFPHELGDFAVLVSSGMTVRQALGYNFLSACTCYLGMAIGIILGDVNDGASYISALAAGVFLYIALVDMMGELSASLEESSRDSIGKTLKMLLLQNVGIFIGISIILVLSFIDF